MRSSKSVPSTASRRWRAAAGTASIAAGLVIAGPASAMATVTGQVSCYWVNADNSVTYSVGYTNTSATTVTIPVGTNNYVTPAPQDRGQPTAFLPGTHNNAWAPTLTQTDMANNPNWYINGVPVSYSGTMPACPSKPVNVSGSTAGYLGATAGVVGMGLYILKSPRRRRALTQRKARAGVPA